MKNIFIIHGAYGNPNENWFPWLKKELENDNYNVFIPEFPTPENQSLKNWLNIFENYKKYINNDTIFIGHSLGVAFLLNIIQDLDIKINKTIFVSGFIDMLGNPVFDDINKSFFINGFDWEKIKLHCNDFYIFHSDNDPYVPLLEAEKIAKELDEKIILIKNAGHFNENAGYTTFEEILKFTS